MKQIIQRVALSVLLFGITLASAQPVGHDAEYQELNKTYTLNKDGSMEYRYSKTIKLLSYNAFHRFFGETFILFNPDYQTLIIHEAYTIMADGKKVVIPENATNEVLPRCADKAPAFNHLREMVITHTGLEIGATIHLDYSIITKEGFYPALMGTEFLAEAQPIENQIITINIPESISLFYHLFSADIKPVVTKGNGLVTYQWIIQQIPATSQERHLVTNGEDKPMLVFSTDKGYDKLSMFYSAQPAFSFSASPLPDSAMVNLIAKKLSETEQILRLQEVVVKELNLFDIPDMLTGYRVRTPDQVWKSNGGTPAEKAVLLTTMLRHRGTLAFPALILQPKTFEPVVGNVSAIETWAVVVNLPDAGETYLAVDQINAFDLRTIYPNETFLVFRPKEPFRIDLPRECVTTIDMKGNMVISDSLALTGTFTGSSTGLANPFLALLRDHAKLKHYFSGGIGSGEIKKLTISDSSPREVLFAFDVKKELSGKTDTSYLFFELPFMKGGSEHWGLPYLEAGRSTPLSLSSQVKEEYTYTLAIPEEMDLLTGEKEIRITNEAGSFHFGIQKKDNLIQVIKSLRIPHSIIEPQQYADVKTLLDQWNAYQNRILVFRRR